MTKKQGRGYRKILQAIRNFVKKSRSNLTVVDTVVETSNKPEEKKRDKPEK
jgi:hypothetical protein